MAISIDGTNGFTTDNAALKLDGTTLVVDDTNNRVGIGTASPSNPLHVLATAAGETTVKFESNQAGAMNVALDVDTDRDCLLQFQEAGTTRWDIFMNGSSGTNPLLIRDDGGTTQGSFDQSGNFKFNSGYGSAVTAYGVRAWVNFTGYSTPTIRDSGNVSSITDNAVGHFTCNLSTAMPDTNFAHVSTSKFTSAAQGQNTRHGSDSAYGDNMTTTSFDIETTNAGNSARVDSEHITAIVLR